MQRFEFNENQTFINPTTDWGFKRLFANEMNKGLLIGFLNKIIQGPPIKDLEYINSEIQLPAPKGMHRLHFDVYCKCSDGSRIIVEMQNYARKAFINRALLYTAASIIDDYVTRRRKGSKNYKISRIYLVAITGEKIFPKVNHAPVRLALSDMDSPTTCILSDKILQIFIELPKFASGVESLHTGDNFLSKFAVALKTMPQYRERPEVMDDDLLMRMYGAADLRDFTDEDRQKYKEAIMNELEYEATLLDYHLEGFEKGEKKGRKEGKLEGKKEGLKLGEKVGLEKGRAEGKLEGLAEGKEEGLKLGEQVGLEKATREVAAKMKAQGITPEVIASCTGLTPEAIAKLE